jgi:hypothetical protein
MLSTSRLLKPADLERATGWVIKPEGACKDDRCVPLGESVERDGLIDLDAFANRMQMALVHDAAAGIWSLGTETSGRALSTAVAPEFSLPDVNGDVFELRSLRGRKVLLVAWASW